MSHFTSMKTRFQNLLYLEKALNRLNINHQREKKVANNQNLQTYSLDVVIPQSNGYDIKFCWNEKEYELIFDVSYWTQPYTVENFIDKIAQQYAGEIIIGESKKLGFQTVKYNQNHDGSNTIVLERWKED